MTACLDTPLPVRIRPLLESDLDEADRVAQVAFGTFVGTPRPERFFGDADWVRTRWRSDASTGLVAEVDGSVVGSSFATRWGSVGILGPLTVDPDRWGRSVGTSLLDATMDVFADWGVDGVGLFTFGDSPKHVGLYQRVGFWPRFLTAVMRAPVPPQAVFSGRLLSELAPPARDGVLRSARALTAAVYPGLDVTGQVDAVARQSLGDTVLVDDAGGLAGLAVCHVGPGSEAGTGNCYIKFGAVAPGAQARARFLRLIDACRGLAARHGSSTLVAGVSAGREEAWQTLRTLGFRPYLQGVCMHRPNRAFYSTPQAYVIDDWR